MAADTSTTLGRADAGLIIEPGFGERSDPLKTEPERRATASLLRFGEGMSGSPR